MEASIIEVWVVIGILCKVHPFLVMNNKLLVLSWKLWYIGICFDLWNDGVKSNCNKLLDCTLDINVFQTLANGLNSITVIRSIFQDRSGTYPNCYDVTTWVLLFTIVFIECSNL